MPSIAVSSGHKNLVALLRARNDNPGSTLTENSPSGFMTLEAPKELYVRRSYWTSIDDEAWESVLLNKQGTVQEFDDYSLVLGD